MSAENRPSEDALASGSVSSLVVKLPAAQATMQQRQEVTLESLTRSYREGLLLDGPSEDEDPETNENVSKTTTSVTQQQRLRQPRRQRPGKALTGNAPPSALSSASWRQTQGVALTATLFDPALHLGGQLVRPPGYFLVTPRLGERANLERRRWALRNTRRGQLLQVLGEPYWPVHSRRPATARPTVSYKNNSIRKEGQQPQQQLPPQNASMVSLASLIKRFPEDFVRLRTPDFKNSGLTGRQVGLSGRPPSATARMATSSLNLSGTADSDQGGNYQQSVDWRLRQRPHTGRLSSCSQLRDPAGSAAGFTSSEWTSEAADQLRVYGSPMLSVQSEQAAHKRCRSAPPKR